MFVYELQFVLEYLSQNLLKTKNSIYVFLNGRNQGKGHNPYLNIVF